MRQIITDDMCECNDNVGRGHKIHAIVCSTKLDGTRNERIRGTTKVGESQRKS